MAGCQRCRTSASSAIPARSSACSVPTARARPRRLRILSTVLHPTGGRAMVAGFDVRTQPEQVRARIGYMSASTGIYDRMSAWELVEYFGKLYGLTARTALRTDGGDLRLAPDGRLPRRARIQDVHWHEAKSLDRPNHRSRPPRADFRRADLGPRRPGRPIAAPEDRRAARPGKDDRLLDARHARGHKALLPGSRSSTRDRSRRKGSLPSSSSGSSSPTWRSSSSTWSKMPEGRCQTMSDKFTSWDRVIEADARAVAGSGLGRSGSPC